MGIDWRGPVSIDGDNTVVVPELVAELTDLCWLKQFNI